MRDTPSYAISSSARCTSASGASRSPSSSSDALDDVCDYPLARNLALLTATAACESALAFLLDGERREFTITLADLAIRPYG